MESPERKNVVLFVDDEESFRVSVKDGLAKWASRFEIITATNGIQALGLIESHDPKLVVSDIRMPKMDGIELLLNCRKLFPNLPIILVSAFFSDELAQTARSFGAAALLHKPVDLDSMVATINNVLSEVEHKNHSQDQFLPYFSLPGFLQLLEMEGRSCRLTVRSSDGQTGNLWVWRGRLVDASMGALQGLKAALKTLGMENPDIKLSPMEKERPVKIEEGINFLLMESARLTDENEGAEFGSGEQKIAKGQDDWLDLSITDTEIQPLEQQKTKPREEVMANMEEVMQKLKDVSGFLAVGAFSPQGEMLGSVASAGMNLGELGALANDVLLKAQKSTDIMGVGRGNMVHITAPKANILVRCLNENTDFSANEPGRAHVHMVLILEAEGNLAMGKMQLEKVIQELAAQVR
jgi:CheY-like chemotaxis protein